MRKIEQIIEQFLSDDYNSDMWQVSRLGRFTASEIFKLMSEPRSKEKKEQGIPGDNFYTYVDLKVGETLTNFSPEFDSEAIAHGNNNERLAIQTYMLESGNGVVEGVKRFVEYGEHAGGSPDGIIITDTGFGILDAKCPYNPGQFISLATCENLKAEYPQYYWQLQFNMMICEADFAELAIFHPMAPVGSNIFIKRIESDAEGHKKLKERLDMAIELKNSILERIYGNA